MDTNLTIRQNWSMVTIGVSDPNVTILVSSFKGFTAAVSFNYKASSEISYELDCKIEDNDIVCTELIRHVWNGNTDTIAVYDATTPLHSFHPEMFDGAGYDITAAFLNFESKLKAALQTASSVDPVIQSAIQALKAIF